MVNRIKKLASEQGVTIAKVESELGLSNGIIGKWKTQEPSAYKLLAVANYLNCTVDYLLNGNASHHSLESNELKLLAILNNVHDKDEQMMLIGVADSYAKSLSSYSKANYKLKQEA